MEFRILGPLDVVENGRSLDLGGQKQRALLAMLLLHANEVVSADRLVEALWEDRRPETAAKALQVYVSGLRKLVGRERVQTKPPGYLLCVDDDELDLSRFRRLCAEGRPREALELWRGPPLGEFAYESFAQTEIAQLEELQLVCREERIDADLADGRHPQVVAELEALVVEAPLRERLRGQLMVALYRSGRQAEALEAYNAARRALVDELGIEPSRELRELHQAILNQDPALDLAARTPAEPDSTRGAFVGRETELAALVAGLDDAFAEHGRLFLLVGEPGIGKSRLAEELVAEARRRGARVLVGRCWEAGGAPAYWPWVQVLRGHVREADPAELRGQLGTRSADLAQLLPELRELFPDVGEPPPLEPDSARFRLFEAVAGVLVGASRARPLVLVLDDLHAADEPSLLLLRFLARELGDSRLFVIGAYRDVDPTPRSPLTATIAELAREPVTRSLALAGLGESDVRTFIHLISGEEPSEELVAAIHEDTEGNPLFVGEIVRLLAAEGQLEHAATSRPTIPQSVRDVIARRLSHLSEECNRVLLLASVLGREFELGVLATVGGLPELRLLDVLDEAMEARVLTDVPGSHGRLRFAHVLIRDTLYDGLTTARRVRLHRLVVETLESRAAADPAELTHHAIAGSDFERALAYARRAGDQALQALAYEDAARLYRTALEALDLTDPGGDEERCRLLVSLGEAESRAGNSLVAKTTFLEAAGIARSLASPCLLARAAAGYGGGHVWARTGADRQLVPLLEEGLAGLPEGDVVMRTRLLARLAGALRDDPSSARRDRISQEAVDLARRSGDPAALAYALEGRVTAIANPMRLTECLDLATELCRLAEQTGDRERMVYGRQARLLVLVTLGAIHEAEADAEEMNALAHQLRQPEHLFQTKAWRSMLALAAGRFSEAEELVPEFYALGERAQPEMALPIYVLHRYALCERRREFDAVEASVQGLVANYPARPVFRCVHAHLDACLGRLDAAREALVELAADDVAALPFDMEWLLGVCMLAETCCLVHERASAPALYRALAPWASLNCVDYPEGSRGSMSRYLGLLAALLGRPDDAERHYEDAIAMNERMGARPWLAHTQHDYARLLADRDPARAAEHLAAARATYAELGMREPA